MAETAKSPSDSGPYFPNAPCIPGAYQTPSHVDLSDDRATLLTYVLLIPVQQLTKRAITGFFTLQLMLGVLIFLPAGTLYWQGQVVWALMALIFAAMMFYLSVKNPKLMERRLRSGPRAEKDIAQKRVMTAMFAFLFSLYITTGLDHRFHLSDVPPALSLLACAAIAVGFFGIFRVFQKNQFAASTIQVEKEQTVISTGPYAVVRHPMYAFGLPIMLGAPIALGSWWGLIPGALLCLTMAWRLIEEEKYLVAHLTGYREYTQRIRFRLIPGVW